MKKLFHVVCLISLMFLCSVIKYSFEQEVKECYINLEVDKIGPRLIKISANTNFPDGTDFMIDVFRTYYKKGKSEDYVGIILLKKNITVTNGKIEELEVNINDSIWYNEYHRKAEKFKGIIDFPNISRISPRIEVQVFFTPRGGSQSKGVLKILGTHGEFISGPGVEKSREWTYYRVSKLLVIPFQKKNEASGSQDSLASLD